MAEMAFGTAAPLVYMIRMERCSCMLGIKHSFPPIFGLYSPIVEPCPAARSISLGDPSECSRCPELLNAKRTPCQRTKR